jgi:Fe-S-cluster-containing dehydrogenase component
MERKMSQYAMVIDLTKCQGCFNCQIVCKDEFVENDWPPYSAAQPDTGHFWMKVEELERGTFPWVKLAHIPQPCMHCDNPPCVTASLPPGAAYKRPDGIVIFDPVKSIGQRIMQTACPYHVVYWNEMKDIPQKCTFCVHLLDSGWREPRCVEACPVGAISFGDLNDRTSDVSKIVKSGLAKPYHGEYGTDPRTFYIGLPEPCLAGSLISAVTDECLEGADVTLTDATSGETVKMKTNNYGDFEFDGLQKERTYSLRIEAVGHSPKVIDQIRITRDCYFLGELVLHGV